MSLDTLDQRPPGSPSVRQTHERDRVIPLLTATTDADPIVRQLATNALLSIAPNRIANTPALLKTLWFLGILCGQIHPAFIFSTMTLQLPSLAPLSGMSPRNSAPRDATTSWLLGEPFRPVRIFGIVRQGLEVAPIGGSDSHPLERAIRLAVAAAVSSTMSFIPFDAPIISPQAQSLSMGAMTCG
jgi:hypothetical protein